MEKTTFSFHNDTEDRKVLVHTDSFMNERKKEKTVYAKAAFNNKSLLSVNVNKLTSWFEMYVSHKEDCRAAQQGSCLKFLCSRSLEIYIIVYINIIY